MPMSKYQIQVDQNCVFGSDESEFKALGYSKYEEKSISFTNGYFDKKYYIKNSYLIFLLKLLPIE